MIRLIFGNVGSGKTASVVRYMKQHPEKNFITNIDVKGKNFKHVIKLEGDMILKKTLVRTKKTGEEVFKLSVNIDFWKQLLTKYKTMNVIIDESHIFFNPRRSMSKINVLMTDFLALLRRVLGSVEGTGELILITQLSRRLDIIAKEMSTDIQFCVHHYTTKCRKCNSMWGETNETSLKHYQCPRCNSQRIERIRSEIEIYKFKNIEKFMDFHNFHVKTYYSRYFITDIEKIFGSYDTLQFDDLLSKFYT